MPSSASFSAEAPLAFQASEALHVRVQNFARETALGKTPSESFAKLALDIALFQRSECEGLTNLWPEAPEHPSELIALPADVFRLTRVALYPEALDVARFRTSGTTAAEAGLHPARTLRTYDELALLLARGSLFRNLEKAVVVALSDVPSTPPSSSLTYMMQRFIDEFDGRSREQTPGAQTALGLGRDCFLMSSHGLDLNALRRAARVAEVRNEPLVILGAAFAFAVLVEAFGSDTLAHGLSEIRLMITGGFKGRRVEMSESELRAELLGIFGPSQTRILGEYGMTELTSQMYEAWPAEPTGTPRPEPFLPRFANGGQAGRYVAPPWLEVTAVDPATGQPVPVGKPGAARFVDLGNIDSVLVVQTDDVIVQGPDGFELLGRREKAPSRGCSLPYEGLLAPHPRTLG